MRSDEQERTPVFYQFIPTMKRRSSRNSRSSADQTMSFEQKTSLLAGKSSLTQRPSLDHGQVRQNVGYAEQPAAAAAASRRPSRLPPLNPDGHQRMPPAAAKNSRKPSLQQHSEATQDKTIAPQQAPANMVRRKQASVRTPPQGSFHESGQVSSPRHGSTHLNNPPHSSGYTVPPLAASGAVAYSNAPNGPAYADIPAVYSNVKAPPGAYPSVPLVPVPPQGSASNPLSNAMGHKAKDGSTTRRRRVSQIDLISRSTSLEEMMNTLDERMEQNDSETLCSLPNRTPEPDWVQEYGVDLDHVENPDDHGYKPKRCWCSRCQIMYRMHQEQDRSLSNWGNYPCHQW